MLPLFKHYPIRLKIESTRWPLVMILLALLGVGCFPVHPLAAQNLESMPWLDQESGQLGPTEISEREAALTRDRGSVPEAKIKKKAAPVNKTARPNTGPGVGSLIGTILIYALLGIAVVAAIGLIVWLIINSRIDLSPGEGDISRPDRSLAESIRHLPFEMDATQGDFRQQAESASQSGDFRRALIFLFSHVLVTLDQAKLVRLKKGKTNRQYLRELSASPPLVGYYGDVMVPFEQTFFGDYPITQDVFEKCWRGLDDFQTTVTTTRAKAARSKAAHAEAARTEAARTEAATQGQGTHA